VRVGDGAPARSITALQRSRLLSAAVGLLAKDGFGSFSASGVCEHAGVSRRTFYELFDNREACLAGILDSALARFEDAIAGLDLAGLGWAERIRTGLWAILCLADQDPALAKVCLIESQNAGGEAKRTRERMTRRLIEVIDEGRLQEARGSTSGAFTAEALIGAVSSVIAIRLTQGATSAAGGRRSADDRGGEVGTVRALLGELTGMILLPYLGPAAAKREIKRRPPASSVVEISQTTVDAGSPSPLADVPIRLTYRTARVLQAVASLTADGLGASNRLVADHAEVNDAGQISKLLWRLQQHGLLENAAGDTLARGEANQWQLTPVGRRLVNTLTQVGTATQRSAA
jgi:AcrR family transcriptional regulator